MAVTSNATASASRGKLQGSGGANTNAGPASGPAQPALLSSIGYGGQGGVAGVVGNNLCGTAVIASGATTVVVTFGQPEPDNNYIVIAVPLTVGSNVAYIVGISSQTAAHFTISCNTDPGVLTLACAWFVIRTA
jgi:hypothetical protein